MRKTLFLSFVVLVCLILPTTAFLCGVERWPVKVAKDPHVRFLFRNGRISSGRLKAARPTTIAALSAPENPIGGGI
jgi:hypothetical protein